MLADIVGWASAVILALTISRQVYTQWRSKSVAGVSKWLFIGQLAASLGFTVYSYLVDNMVFVCTNFFMFMTAVVGECIYVQNRRRARREADKPQARR
jgi:MtN3 and saliva related transmembrane protein